MVDQLSLPLAVFETVVKFNFIGIGDLRYEISNLGKLRVIQRWQN
ncbi:hypothetical protein [Okeania sp. SIO3B5]|nr:hypothetical protein [Okeania sp. SIO3B5]